jgi:hypothetical protein
MKNICMTLGLCLLFAVSAMAQSSGNFSYGTSGGSLNCTMDNNGTISGGALCSTNSTGGVSVSCTSNADCLAYYGSNSGATCDTTLGTCVLPAPNTNCGGNFFAGIKTSSGNGNVFVIRPSLVIGLLTNVTVSSKQLAASGTTSSSALAGVNVGVSVGAESGQGAPTVIPNFPVTYDARFVQISTNLFQALATQCTTITNGCFLTFAQSTVSAHSFDWIVSSLSSGNYGVTLNWSATVNGTGQFSALTCVGPVNLTVQQNKIFSQNTVNSL